MAGSVGSVSGGDALTRVLLDAAVQQQTDLAKKLIQVNTEQAVKGAAQAGLGDVLDALV